MAGEEGLGCAQAGRAVPELQGIEQVSSGWINKYLLTYRMPDGRPFTYEGVSRKGPEAFRAALEGNAAGRPPVPDALCIVPRLPDGSYLLIREFRYALNSWCVSFPAGLIEPGESLGACADRELHEEAGCRVRFELGEAAVRPLPQPGYSSTGLAEENVQVAFVEAELDGEPQPEDNELIETFTLHPNQIERFLAENRTPIGTRCQLVLWMLAKEHA